MILKKLIKKKKKAEKPLKPNVHFYKNGVVVSKVYIERGEEEMKKAVEKAQKELGADGYYIVAVTGAGGYFDLKKKKRWGKP